MTKQRERSIHELYEDDPERADALVFGRRAKVNRRGFLGGAGVAAMGAAVGSAIERSRCAAGSGGGGDQSEAAVR
jgi:hypothetical protein